MKKIVILTLHLHPNMFSLNPVTPNHGEFLDITKLIHHVTIDCQKFTQIRCERFKEVTKYMIVESTGVHYLFQFLVNKNNPGNTKEGKYIVISRKFQ